MDTHDFIHALAQEGPKKPFPRPLKLLLAWLAVTLAYFIIQIVIFGLRDDVVVKLNQPIFIIEQSTMLITALLAAWAACILALPDSNQKPWIRFIPLIPLGFLITILIHGMMTTSMLTLTECLELGRYDCVIQIMLYSLIPAIIMFYTLSKGAPIRCCWAGAMAGLSAASLGYVLLRFIDISDDPTQLLVWHFVPVIIVTFMGFMLGKTLLGQMWKR